VFVQQQQFGAQPGGHQQGQALALAAGQGADGIVQAIFQAHPQGADPGAHLRAASGTQKEKRGQVRFF
jgi:hypothetical protein